MTLPAPDPERRPSLRKGNAVASGARYAYRHVGVDANVCAYGCVGFTFQHGHLYFKRGGGAIAGAEVGPTFYSKPLNPNRKNRNVSAMVGPVSASVTRNDLDKADVKEGWSVGWSAYGIPSLFLGPMEQERIR